jgi:TRAP-type mannitol/chloroaromatic compound transport system permease small subunit
MAAVTGRPMPRWSTAYVRSVESVAWLVGRATMFLIFAMIAVLIWSSISKYYRIPAIWTLEVSQFLMVGYFLLGGAYAMQLGDHVRMDLAYAFWSPRRRAMVDSVTIVFLLIYLGVLLYGGISSTTYAITVGERNFSAWRPLMWPIKVIMVVGITLMLLQTVATFLRDLATALGRDIGVPPTEGHDPDVPGEAEAMTERRA